MSSDYEATMLAAAPKLKVSSCWALHGLNSSRVGQHRPSFNRSGVLMAVIRLGLFVITLSGVLCRSAFYVACRP